MEREIERGISATVGRLFRGHVTKKKGQRSPGLVLVKKEKPRELFKKIVAMLVNNGGHLRKRRHKTVEDRHAELRQEVFDAYGSEEASEEALTAFKHSIDAATKDSIILHALETLGLSQECIRHWFSVGGSMLMRLRAFQRGERGIREARAPCTLPHAFGKE